MLSVHYIDWRTLTEELTDVAWPEWMVTFNMLDELDKVVCFVNACAVTSEGGITEISDLVAVIRILTVEIKE